ncbi:MAG: nucleotidyltransferase domain-containing protein [Methylobacillus sp.]|nr:nucleotidyltransferase domain-containing protein [Methylobacillus sp.]
MSRAVAPARVSVADALFTATQRRVLALLFGQPERSFFTKELIALAGGGSGAVQRELARLQASGLIVQTVLGNQKHYQADKTAPIFTELCGIATKMLSPADALHQALAPLAATLQLALLYGSVAKRSDTAHSDFDLLLVSDTLTLEQVYATLASAEQQLGRTVNPTLYTSEEFHKRLAARNPFLTKLLAGETVALIGDKHVFAAAG